MKCENPDRYVAFFILNGKLSLKTKESEQCKTQKRSETTMEDNKGAHTTERNRRDS